MFKHILIPTDGSPLAQIAIDQGFALAKEAGAKVTVVTVSEPFHVIASDVEDIAEEEFHRCEEAEHLLRDTQAQATSMGLDCEALLARAGRPDEAIIEAANRSGCDLIAMASHRRRSFLEMLLGSVTAKVLKNSKIPVLVYRQ
ncbi:universal stress protein [Agrobacterium radiobacter]|uniref:Universal stress protein n=1 Tax=Agrobacterium tumefaciens str. B6 TaxID=1183423 RepID=A0A822V3S8_AGRTU|nr:universal stress protein [Agrobacterium tumefaciens]AYM04379.1 universal stress protein UspA [Agrobacterium tumefaciens]KWT88903.1 universal stress protein UspA [Agrobacterium tumefaciens str. B6]MQB23832.1 universal stress protein [Agrobacterium tumefaciens]NSZ31240.1 universal stress protein [Agrobacterium tumefaciens]NTA03717.1 universal stress protein [Agrobacterium tumefaciens]